MEKAQWVINYAMTAAQALANLREIAEDYNPYGYEDYENTTLYKYAIGRIAEIQG